MGTTDTNVLARDRKSRLIVRAAVVADVPAITELSGRV
jgi:hypothetical protein